MTTPATPTLYPIGDDGYLVERNGRLHLLTLAELAAGERGHVTPHVPAPCATGPVFLRDPAPGRLRKWVYRLMRRNV